MNARVNSTAFDTGVDETVPDHLQQDGHLWSGCLSGAFREDLFLEAFAEAGFHGITIAKRETKPWQTIEGIEFRSMTVIAWKVSPFVSSSMFFDSAYSNSSVK